MSKRGTIATRVDVENCYRVLLGREPESAEVVREMVDSKPVLWDLIRHFLASEEAVAGRSRQAALDLTFKGAHENFIEVDAAPGKLDDLFGHVRQVWSQYGEEDPYWSILTGPQFRLAAMNAASEEAFYHTGRAQCDLFTKACLRNAIALPVEGLVLDFGCGLGRLGEHLSHDFARYAGVDISRPHLERARTRMQQLGRTNCEFHVLTDFIDSPLRFDAFMSIIVLQHNPPPVMKLLLNNLLGRLNPGGVGYFQLPCVLFNYEFRLDDYLSRLAEPKGMEMHALPQRTVFQAIAENDCRLIEMTLDGQIGNCGVSYTFLVEKVGARAGAPPALA